jgi:hypothetical protein
MGSLDLEILFCRSTIKSPLEDSTMYGGEPPLNTGYGGARSYTCGLSGWMSITRSDPLYIKAWIFPLQNMTSAKHCRPCRNTLQDIYIIMKKPNLNEQKHNEHHLYKNKTKNITFQWRYTVIDESLLSLSIGGKSL